ncbi:MAG TPA: aldolase/citrate lyase family protein [bacterium]
MIENSILKANREGRKALAFALVFPSLHLIELAAHVGFDSINLDGEHGYFNEQAIDDACRVANGYGMSVTARVPDIAPYQINLYLDRGIQGVTGPHIETGAQAQALADACLFPPDGKRSWGGGRGTEFNDDVVLNEKYGGKLQFAKWSNANMIVTAQIESKKAWDNLDDILAVKGLTGVTGGPNDFAASLGFPGQPDHPDRVAATLDVEKRARAAGKTAGGRSAGTGAAELMLGEARRFVAEHRNDKLS